MRWKRIRQQRRRVRHIQQRRASNYCTRTNTAAATTRLHLSARRAERQSDRTLTSSVVVAFFVTDRSSPPLVSEAPKNESTDSRRTCQARIGKVPVLSRHGDDCSPPWDDALRASMRLLRCQSRCSHQSKRLTMWHIERHEHWGWVRDPKPRSFDECNAMMRRFPRYMRATFVCSE